MYYVPATHRLIVTILHRYFFSYPFSFQCCAAAATHQQQKCKLTSSRCIQVCICIYLYICYMYICMFMTTYSHGMFHILTPRCFSEIFEMIFFCSQQYGSCATIQYAAESSLCCMDLVYLFFLLNFLIVMATRVNISLHVSPLLYALVAYACYFEYLIIMRAQCVV